MKQKLYLNTNWHRYFMLWLLIFMFPGFASSQSSGSNGSFNFETGVNTITACGANVQFRVKLTAVAVSTGNTLSITMPTGVQYVPSVAGGGLTILSGTGTISEADISSLSAPTFTIGNLVAGQVLEFNYMVRANCEIIPFIEALNTPLNSFSFTSTGPAAHSETFSTIGFNVLYGVPSITDVWTNGVSTAGYVGNIGDEIVRKVFVKNGGNGAVTSSYLELDGTYSYSSIEGPFSAGASLTGSRLALSGAAFGGDGIWSPDETIEVTYTEKITSCPAGTPSRNVYAGYGCSSTDCKISQVKATQVSTPYLPNLSMRVVNNTIHCPGEEPYTAAITIVNRGQGTARNFMLQVNNAAYSSVNYDEHVYLDTAAVMYTLNGGAPIHPYKSSFSELFIGSTNRLCNPGVASIMTGLARYNFGDLAPGDSLVLYVSGNSCLDSRCQNIKSTFWSGYASWKQGCSDVQSPFGDIPTSGQTPGGAYVSIADNGAVQITGSNQPVEIGFNYLNYFIGDINNGGYINICVTIPPGLTLDETQPDAFVIANVTDPSQIWRPSSYVRNGNTICFKFLHNTLTPGVLANYLAVQKFSLSQDCASGSGVLPLSFTYTVKNTDACTLEHQLACYTRDIVSLCPSPPCPQGGLILISSDAIRTNYGLPDNDNNAHADGSGTIDFSKVATTQYILGDTMRYTYAGMIAGTSNIAAYPGNDAFNYAYVNVGIPTTGPSAFFKLLGSAKVIVKKEAGGTVTCTVPGVASTTDFSVLLNGCADLTGYVFQPGDSVWVEQLLHTISTANMANQAVTPTISYASDILNPDVSTRYGCGISYSRYRVSGFDANSHGGNYSLDCQGNANAYNAGFLRNNIYNGATGGAYGYGNAFPYEYRNISYPVKFKYLLPAGYAYDPTNTKYVHFDVGPGQVSLNFPLNEPTMSGDTLVFDISNIYTANGGTLDFPDEGFNVSPVIVFKSICGAPASALSLSMTAVQITADPEIARLLALAHPATGTAPYQNVGTYSGNQYIYTGISGMFNNPYPLVLNPISTVSNSEDGTAIYRIRLSNDATSLMPNTWLYAKNEKITITEIVDETSNTVIMPDANGFFKLGDYAGGYARNYTLRGILAECEDAEDFIFAGSCGAYPASINNTCAKDTLLLEAHPGETDFQTILTGPNGEVPLCQDADFSFEIKASKLGNVKDMRVNFLLPNGSSIVSGSVKYSYPGDAVAVTATNPASLTGTAVFNVAGYSSQLTNVGLRGVGTADPDSSTVKVSFKVRTDCNYSPGSVFRANYFANDACGNALDPRSNTADLSIPGLGALPYRTTVLILNADTAHCENTPVKMVVQVTNVLGGTATGNNDSIYVELPPNVSFAGYTPAANGGDYLNAPTGAPSVYGIAGGYTRVSFLLPSGVIAGGNINFPFNYSLNTSAALCSLDSVKAYTGVTNITGCSSAPGGSCTVLVLNSVVPGRTIPYYQPEATFAYSAGRFCAADAAASPILDCESSASKGKYSSTPTGLSINPNTGVIDPTLSASGSYLVTYSITASGTSCLASSDTTTVTINGGTCPPLPVTLVKFTAVKEGSTVSVLNWTTVSETNSDHFEIQRSVTGKSWKNIGKLASSGESRTTLNYSFKDNTPADGENLYRLKMIDKDGSFAYSRIVSVVFEMGQESIYPNPASDKLEIRSKDWSTVSKVEIYNQAGVMMHQSLSRPSKTVDVKSYAPGVYVIWITHSNGTLSSYKVVVSR